MSSKWKISEEGAPSDHETHMQEVIEYSSVITREAVHISLTMTVLDDLEVKAADVLNVYVTTSNREKIWTVLGPELSHSFIWSERVQVHLLDHFLHSACRS